MGLKCPFARKQQASAADATRVARRSTGGREGGALHAQRCAARNGWGGGGETQNDGRMGTWEVSPVGVTAPHHRERCLRAGGTILRRILFHARGVFEMGFSPPQNQIP